MSLKMREIFNVSKADNKYDAAIRSIYMICFAAGFIIFVTVGMNAMNLQTWLLTFVCCIAGAAFYGTVAKMIINMVRKDRQRSKTDTLIQLFYVVFFAMATVAFLAIGYQEKNAKTWVVAFVGSYGAAVIYSAIARLIITLARKDHIEKGGSDERSVANNTGNDK